MPRIYAGKEVWVQDDGHSVEVRYGTERRAVLRPSDSIRWSRFGNTMHASRSGVITTAATTYISRVKRSIINPTISRHWKIADALDTPLSQIVKRLKSWTRSVGHVTNRGTNLERRSLDIASALALARLALPKNWRIETLPTRHALALMSYPYQGTAWQWPLNFPERRL